MFSTVSRMWIQCWSSSAGAATCVMWRRCWWCWWCGCDDVRRLTTCVGGSCDVDGVGDVAVMMSGVWAPVWVGFVMLMVLVMWLWWCQAFEHLYGLVLWCWWCWWCGCDDVRRLSTCVGGSCDVDDVGDVAVMMSGVWAPVWVGPVMLMVLLMWLWWCQAFEHLCGWVLWCWWCWWCGCDDVRRLSTCVAGSCDVDDVGDVAVMMSGVWAPVWVGPVMLMELVMWLWWCQAFEHLCALELVRPATGSAVTDSHSQRLPADYRIMTLHVDPSEIMDALQRYPSCPTDVKQWAASSLTPAVWCHQGCCIFSAGLAAIPQFMASQNLLLSRDT